MFRDVLRGSGSWGLANPDGDNNNPWLIGANRYESAPREPDSGTEPFIGGAIDQLRISRVRRDYSTSAP